MLARLDNRVTLITGAGKVDSIGANTAILLSQYGSNIVVNSHSASDEAMQVVNECKSHGVEVELHVGDLTNKEDCNNLYALIKNKWNKLDIVVNCVGSTVAVPYNKFAMLTVEDFQNTFSTNVIAQFLIAQVFCSMLKLSDMANFINVSSNAGITGKGSSVPYAVAKGAENTLTLALTQIMSPEVRVNAVCPSFVDSSWWGEFKTKNPEKFVGMVDNIRLGNVLNKVISPQDVARTILMIIDSPAMNGELIRLDLGSHIGGYR